MPKVGQRNNRIVAISPHYGQRGRLKCVVRCDCGVEKEIWAGNFYKTESCGCLRVEVLSRPKKHGLTCGGKPPEFTVWNNMRRRCSDPNALSYENYGGRGIKVCARWLDFGNFYADMGPRPLGLTIERIDNNGNYEPGNCRWATRREQGRNKRTNVHVEVDGRRLVKSEAAETSGINYGTLHGRIERGWSGDEATSRAAVSRPVLDLQPGRRFGHLVVVEFVGRPVGPM